MSGWDSRRPDPTGPVTGEARSAVSSGTATVRVGGLDVTVNVVRGLTLAVGDPVLLLRSGSAWWCIARTYTTAVTPEPDVVTPPPSTPTTGQLVCYPVETRSYRNTVYVGWRTDTTNVYQGTYGGYGRHVGCAFYGTKPRSLDGATVTSAYIRVKRLSGGDYAARTATLWLVDQATRPAGAPTLSSSTTGPSLAVGESEYFTIPDAHAQALVDGDAGGLAIYESDGSPYMILAGKGVWTGAWALTINWRR